MKKYRRKKKMHIWMMLDFHLHNDTKLVLRTYAFLTVPKFTQP